jgi:hypothetical protein
VFHDRGIEEYCGGEIIEVCQRQTAETEGVGQDFGIVDQEYNQQRRP